MIIPGLVSATFKEKSEEEVIHLCQLAGLKAIEWSENAHVMPNDPEGARSLYAKTRAAGLSIAAYGSYYKLGQQEKSEESFKKSLVSAQNLHAPMIRIWAGTKASNEVTDQERNEMVQEARIICEMAARVQIKVALEWHKNTLTDTNESAIQFLKETNHKNLYCLWQPTVALNEEQRCEGLTLLKDRLLNLHVYYWLDGKRRPFREGKEFWQRYLNHVPAGERFGLLEFVLNNTTEQFLEDAKEWIQLLNKLQHNK